MTWWRFGRIDYKQRYERECERSRYFERVTAVYQITAFKNSKSLRASEKGVRRLVEKVKRLKAELKVLKNSEG